MSTLGWIILILFAAMLISVNITLWNVWKNKKYKNPQIEILTRAARQLKDPLQKQNAEFEELSRRVAALRASEKSDDLHPPRD